MIDGNEGVDHRIEIFGDLVDLSKRSRNFESALLYQKMLEEARVFDEQQKRDRQIHLIELRLEVSRIEYERELYRVKAEQALSAAEEQARQLGTVLTSLEERRNALRTLRSEVAEITADTPADVRIRRILQEIDRLLGSEEQSTKVQALVESIEPDFANRLASRYPKLSKAEISVCLFLKIGLRSVDIANVLKTSERTVENHRRIFVKNLGCRRLLR
jgi:DNA-binding NarL/FixJ family response regulator